MLCDFTIWILDTQSVQYSDESGIQIQIEYLTNILWIFEVNILL